ncbi:putative cytochrome P450 monooxygenase [Hypoxylon trugodes]|uniref:putative cytochrome P450 monooxygenase n=1 Tax=Hypoxylon trugodes TaxID=326681 RepID=UPI002197022D|nr:putative cytochrome P450 monooxygenase [Hypoxylon trugodes]KAI1389246.1 putative cytochrome P450 monooxygenase [Hypoxylon trugodes]
MSSLFTGDFSIPKLALLVILLSISYHVSISVYNLLFHPLASYPGPILHRISILPRTAYLLRGELPFHVTNLHAKYGPVVRIAPDELAFCDPQAWKDIYGHKPQGQDEFPKDNKFYRPIKSTPANIFSSSRNDHALLRRQLAHGFSDRSMREQEHIIGAYVDLLVKRLQEHSKGGTKALNMREWLNWTTFDIIGDLGLGSSFECLEKAEYNPWVRVITKAIKSSSYMQAITAVGGTRLVTWVAQSGLWKSRQTHRQLVREKVMQRMELGAERPDLIEGLLKKQKEWQMSLRQISINASRLIVAGSETTATLLSGTVFFLTTHEDKLAKLAHEVRSSFKSDEEITLSSVGDLTYMLACLDECLRMYPPVAVGFPRVTPKGGGTIAGHFIPAGYTVSVWQWAINHDPRFWTDPYEFKPERFLGDPRYKNDRFDAMQPFSVGPRNCIGKNLAYAEMRLILAKIIYNFDMRLDDGALNWLASQKNYVLWDKPVLGVYITPVTQ